MKRELASIEHILIFTVRNRLHPLVMLISLAGYIKAKLVGQKKKTVYPFPMLLSSIAPKSLPRKVRIPNLGTREPTTGLTTALHPDLPPPALDVKTG